MQEEDGLDRGDCSLADDNRHRRFEQFERSAGFRRLVISPVRTLMRLEQLFTLLPTLVVAHCAGTPAQEVLTSHRIRLKDCRLLNQTKAAKPLNYNAAVCQVD